MTRALPRTILASLSGAAILSLALAGGALAQVATLVSPDETPAPEAEAAAADPLAFEDREEAMLAFAQCMRDNGVDMDDPQTGSGGGRLFLGRGPGEAEAAFDRFSEEFRVAQEACTPILEAARPETDPEAEQERLEEQLLLAQCIRDNGYPEYPDPVIGSDGRLERLGGLEMEELGIDRLSPEFQELMGTCRDELGLEAGGFGPGGLGLGRGDN